ncbi:MAG: hypothetical protein QXM44_02555 [Candidatus Bathyarchaeia archaeon]
MKSRVTGYPGFYDAADYIKSKLVEYNINVEIHRYVVAVPLDAESYIEFGGKIIKAGALWPNGIQTSATPTHGIKGRAVYVGRGRLEDFNGYNVNGSIVIMDFNSGDNWLNAARLGIIPYEPGMEFYVYGGAPGGWEPFSYMIMGTVGVPFFIGVITWWKGRERIRRVWNAIRGKETYVEAGLPLKPVGILSIISTLAFIVLGLASGAAILPFLFYVFWLYFIFWPSAARGWAEVCEAGEGDFDVTRAWVYPYSVGIATGSWSSELPNNNPSWFVQLNIMYHANAGGPWQSYYWPLNASQLISWYKIAYDNKVNMKHIFIGMIIAVIVTTITGFYVSMYLITHGGGIVNTSAETWRPWMIYGGGWQDAWLWRGGTITTAWQWLIAGFFVGLLIYGAKIYIPALPLNVAAFYVACYCANLFWFDALVALIVKTIAVRALGVKQWVRIAVPVVAGICAGLGASYIFAMPIEFFTRSWPKFASLYTP